MVLTGIALPPARPGRPAARVPRRRAQQLSSRAQQRRSLFAYEYEYSINNTGTRYLVPTAAVHCIYCVYLQLYNDTCTAVEQYEYCISRYSPVLLDLVFEYATCICEG